MFFGFVPQEPFVFVARARDYRTLSLKGGKHEKGFESEGDGGAQGFRERHATGSATFREISLQRDRGAEGRK